MTEHRSLLSKITDAFLRPLEHRQTGDLLVIKKNLTIVRDNKTCDHIEACGLSCSIRSEESHNLSLIHFHRHTLDHSPRAIFLNKVFATKFHTYPYLISNPKSFTSPFTSGFSAMSSFAWSLGM